MRKAGTSSALWRRPAPTDWSSTAGGTTGVNYGSIDDKFQKLSIGQVQQALRAFLAAPSGRLTNSLVANEYELLNLTGIRVPKYAYTNTPCELGAGQNLELAILQFCGVGKWRGWPKVPTETAFALYPLVSRSTESSETLAAYAAKSKAGPAVPPAVLLKSYTDEIDLMLTNKFVYSPAVEQAIKLAERQRLASSNLMRQVTAIIAAVDDPRVDFSDVGIARAIVERYADPVSEQGRGGRGH